MRPSDHRTPWLIVSAAFLKTGGQDRANYALASYLANQGQPVHLVAHDIAEELAAHPNVTSQIVQRPLNADFLGEPFLHRAGMAVARTLNLPASHVVVNGGNCPWPGVNWVHYVHAAYDRSEVGGFVRRAHMRLTHRRWLADERRALLRAKVVIANSERTRRDVIDRVGVPADRVKVIYYGIDPTDFHPASVHERCTVRRELDWPDDRPVVLFVGGLGDRRKGFDTLFEAWNVLLKRGGQRDLLLVVIGSGALLPEWRRRVAGQGIERSVRFLGFRRDVPRLMRAADALVSPTRYEAYGLGVHEAIACGLPAIVSADAGVAEKYPDGLRDLLLPDADNAVDLAQRLEACVSARADRGQDLTRFATTMRARAWDDMASELANCA